MIREEKPVLGICRGMQLINVFFGGSLIQNLDASFRHARRGGDPDRVHDSFARKGSWIEEIYGGHFFHNSAHHQGSVQKTLINGVPAAGEVLTDDMLHDGDTITVVM